MLLPDSDIARLEKTFTSLLNHFKYVKTEWISSHYSINKNKLANIRVSILIKVSINSIKWEEISFCIQK